MAKMQFLKKQSTVLPTQDVKWLLHNHLSGYSEGRPLSRIHASELTKPEGLCPRMYALSDVLKMKPPGEFLSTSSYMTFQIGRDQEKNIVNWFADMGKAICHWRCLSCKRLHEFQSRPFKCVECEYKAFDPVEVRFKSGKCGASCGVDMLLNLGEGKLRPIEIKTMDKDEFKTLVAPLSEHRLRTNLYLRLISEDPGHWSKLVNTKEATILYVSKGGFGVKDDELKQLGLSESFSPFKRWNIKRDDSQTDVLVARASVVQDFRNKLVGMPCGLCKTALDKRAQSCLAKKACFSGDHPVEYDWKEV